ncbi:MAG: glycosyltransferase family 2 protein [Acidobacteria bacterium]|nr:glycosyltransferase family 2 protein [Acidobacteriota bacterium]
MDLSIIIVNWKSSGFLKDCLSSIVATTRGLDYEIVVVDNASEPAACLELAANKPEIKVICSDRNLGFAGANNLGLQHASADRILFLNPDTVVLDKAIHVMVKALESSPDIGAVGCRLLNSDRSLQTTCVQPFPTLINQLLGIGWLQRATPRLQLWGIQALFSAADAAPQDVDVISGACLMATRSVLDGVSGFSTDYFMYAEEVDLCCKIRRAGKRVCYVGGGEIIHFGGQSSKERGSTFSDVVMRESVYTLLGKFKGAGYARAYRVLILLSALLRLSLLVAIKPITRFTSWPISAESAGSGIRKWVKIARWSLTLEPWVNELNQTHSTPPAL